MDTMSIHPSSKSGKQVSKLNTRNTMLRTQLVMVQLPHHRRPRHRRHRHNDCSAMDVHGRGLVEIVIEHPGMGVLAGVPEARCC